MSDASLVLVLHAHLPFVKHPEHEVFFEESWLFEAVCETYAPLVWALEEAAAQGARVRLTMSLTPPLLTMLEDSLLIDRLRRHVENRIALAEKDLGRRGATSRERELASFYRDRFARVRETVFDRHGGKVVRAFRELRDRGLLEPITCAATHGFLPLIASRGNVRAQLREGVKTHERILGAPPRGIWLPECAYAPGIERFLAEVGIDHFFLETHGLTLADDYPVYDVYAPIELENGVRAFARDPESSKQVWSAEEGYPGDFVYREFHRDIAWDRDMEFIRPHVLPDGARVPTGLKYHRVTGRDVELGSKDLYDPARASEQARAHAAHFADARAAQVARLAARMDRAPVICAPFDAELFGHWWFEGPEFLKQVWVELARRPGIVARTAAEALDEREALQVTTPSASSWGDGGYFEVWLNGTNDGLYRHYDEMARRMADLAPRARELDGDRRRALDQAGRELLLAQASDWAFLVTVGTARPFAERQVKDHIRDFFRCEAWARDGGVDAGALAEIEARDAIFPDIDVTTFADERAP